MKRPHLESWPRIIQGGMGVNVSGWNLAKAVSKAGQLGVVSGVALDQVMTRRLQLGDPGGHIRRALEAFPHHQIVEKVLEKYFRHKPSNTTRRFKTPPMLRINLGQELKELLVVSNFVEVFLAKEGHDKPVGINYLEKMQMATLPSLYGAMLAGVSFVLMGAGIPREIPKVLDLFSNHQEAAISISVEDASKKHFSHFLPGEVLGDYLPEQDLIRPYFLPIVSSHVLAQTLVKKSSSQIDGLILEGQVAGGHNAPPRGNVKDEEGHPIYGPRDEIDLERIKALGLPFYLAGGYTTSEKLKEALSLGARGIQVGSIFALSKESNLEEKWKAAILKQQELGQLGVRTDGKASPTGFPFKVASIQETVSEKNTFEARERRCDVGCLRKPYETASGEVDYRCPAEPVADFLRKGGKLANAEGARCLCNGLLANVGLAQAWSSIEEPVILTLGNTTLPKVFLERHGDIAAAEIVDSLVS